MFGIRRREFISLLGGAAGWPLAARAQQPMPVLGYLSSARDDLLGRQSAFLKGLSETGFVEGRSVAIEYRFAENQLDRLLALADELVRRPVNVLAAEASRRRQQPRRRPRRSRLPSSSPATRSSSAWSPA